MIIVVLLVVNLWCSTLSGSCALGSGSVVGCDDI